MNAASCSVIADVRVSDCLSRVVATPRQDIEAHALGSLLRESLPGIPVRRSAGGFWLAAVDSPFLLQADSLRGLRWTEEARQVANNRVWARQRREQLLQEVVRIRDGGKETARAYLRGVSGLDTLDDHQWVNVAAMTLPNSYGLCVFDEQGAGKTVTLIFAFDVLVARDEVDFALIVAPKSMIAEWPRDFTRFKGDLYKVVIVTGARQQKRAALWKRADVLVTNFETTVSMEDELRALLRRYQGRAMLVVDESFYMKNLDAQRTRSLRRLREFCFRAYVLCGTPAPNSPHDLIQQFNIVDFGLTFAGVDIPEGRELAQPVVQKIIESRGPFVRHLKRNVLPNLPGKRFNRIVVPLAAEQKRLYAGALKNLILDVRSTDHRSFQRQLPSFLARRSALLQICSNPIGIADCYSEVPAKVQALDALFVDLIERRHEKVVVWSFYTASLQAIFNRYTEFHPVRYDGTVSDVSVRREAVRRFQEDDETMLFIANPAAAGAGLTLHRARIAVYESMSNQAAHYLQSVDRIHRRGQTRSVEYVVLLCNGTIEMQEYERLTRKERAAHQLLGDQIDEPVTREAMLSELSAAGQMLIEAV